MAHKINTPDDAIALMEGKGVTVDTLASAIVRGRGLSMTDNKREYLEEYVKVSNKLSEEFWFVFERMFKED